MKTRLFRHTQSLSRYLTRHCATGCVLTIGNFDGFHLGHQQLVQKVQLASKRLELPSVLMTFEPTPLAFFAPEQAPPRLMTLHEKWRFIVGKVDVLLVIRFNQRLAQLNERDFVHTIVHQQLNAKHVIVGDDFHYGAKGQGNIHTLKTHGQALGFIAEDTPTVQIEGDRVSSTRIRHCLASHDIAQVNRLLGHPMCFYGRVISGRQLGRTIGFPTLNLHPNRAKLPLVGVYAVAVTITFQTPTGGQQQERVNGVCNIGFKPTIDGHQPSIEVHCLTWSSTWQNWIPSHMHVRLLHFIRTEQKFDGLQALTQQIGRDKQAALQFFQTQ